MACCVSCPNAPVRSVAKLSQQKVTAKISGPALLGTVHTPEITAFGFWTGNDCLDNLSDF